MLTRLYVDNYKALVNFELHLKGLTLLTGRNGTGKTSVLEVLQILRSFASDGQAISDLLTADTLTRWETRGLQTLELDLEVDGHSLTYKVTVEHKGGNLPARVRDERLLHHGKPLFEASLGDDHMYHAQLYRDDHSRGPTMLADWTRSGVAQMQERPENQKLIGFRERLRNVQIVTVDPWAMKPESEREESELAWDMRNFVSWYRHVRQERSRQQEPFFEDLRARSSAGLKTCRSSRRERRRV